MIMICYKTCASLFNRTSLWRYTVDDLSASPIVQFRIVSWISYGYVFMRLPYHNVEVLGSLDRHDM